MDGNLSSRIRFCPCHVRVAADHFFNKRGVHFCPLHGCLEDDDPKLDTVHVLEGAEKIPDCRPYSTDDNYFVHLVLLN